MRAIPIRLSRVLQIAAAMLLPMACSYRARADIFQWEYVDPADPSQGKRQSTTLAPDGAGVDAVPGANLSNRNLTMAYLIGADLKNANGSQTNFTNAELSQANLANATLTNASFGLAVLTEADFAGAKVLGTRLGAGTCSPGFGCGGIGAITLTQLYSTASYQARDLNGIGLDYHNISGGNFSNQNLTNASFAGATLTGADLTGAEVLGTNFAVAGRCFPNYRCDGPGSGITPAQLYTTSSYQVHELTGIGLAGNILAGVNFAGQNLTNASLSHATLTDGDFRNANLTDASFESAAVTGADFADAEVRGANFSKTGITLAQVYSTASYQAHDLTGIDLAHNIFPGANFAAQNLTHANVFWAYLMGADFTNADVRGATFGRDRDREGTGVTLEQLYSTASYKAHDLSGIALLYHNLTGANFTGLNLANASFSLANLTAANFRHANLTNVNLDATLTGADFTGADARGAYRLFLPASATTTNLIRPDGHINGFDLGAGGLLVVRDYEGGIPITVDQHLAMSPGGTLRMVFESDAWDSTISFAPGIPVTLGGTLELTFAADVNLTSQVGRTFDLFDWTGVTPTGAFNVASPYHWNLSNLYTTGEVTLNAIPEPGGFAPAAAGAFALTLYRRRKIA